MEIEEASIVGNISMIEVIDRALGLDPKSPEYMKYVKILAGDQLTVAHQRAIANIRAGHESRAEAWKQVVMMPGISHSKIADSHCLLKTHFGKPNTGTCSPGDLTFHNTVLNRQPVVLTSLPTFRICRDLIMVSLYAHILHCLLHVSRKATLQEYTSSISSFSILKESRADDL